MRFSTLRMLLAARYERLFARRFRLENECDNDVHEDKDLIRRKRFSVAGSIFPSEAILPRYQY